MSSTIVPFYSHSKGPLRYMSNFYSVRFKINLADLLIHTTLSQDQRSAYLLMSGPELSVSSSEQGFMLAKALTFDDLDMVDQIINSSTPAAAKALGRKIKNYDDRVWGSVRETYMYICCLCKFKQNRDLKQILLDTGSDILVEAAPSDKIWGVGLSLSDPKIMNPVQWRGKNLLGECLMKVREELRA